MAITYFHPLWPDVPSDDALERGWALLQEARDLAPGTGRDEAYIAALETYYRDGVGSDERTRLESYAAGWEEVHRAFPEDPEAALLYALALTAAASGTDLTFASQREAGRIAESVMARIPDHPGAHHYVIHAYDSPPLAESALPRPAGTEKVARENYHALHMTSHIFTRLGLWDESIGYNTRAADLAFGERVDGGLVKDHLHSVDYMAYAYLQRGEDNKAREVLTHLESLDMPIENQAASAYAFAAVPARIAFETQDWAAAAAVEPRWPASIPWDQYLSWRPFRCSLERWVRPTPETYPRAAWRHVPRAGTVP